jgi:hypothetical protein
MSKLKTGGFNFQDLEKDNTDLGSMFSVGEEKNMDRELRIKKKKKFNFDKLFPAPKNNENMGMDDFGTGKPFEGLL